MQCLALLRSFVLNASWCICTTNLFGGPESWQQPGAFNCCNSAGPLSLAIVARRYKCLSIYYLQCSGNFKVHPSTPYSGSGLSVMELIYHFLGLVETMGGGPVVVSMATGRMPLPTASTVLPRRPGVGGRHRPGGMGQAVGARAPDMVVASTSSVGSPVMGVTSRLRAITVTWRMGDAAEEAGTPAPRLVLPTPTPTILIIFVFSVPTATPITVIRRGRVMSAAGAPLVVNHTMVLGK